MPKSRTLSGADRYNFMLALTGYLITRGPLPASQVASHFEVSEEELRSALITISLSGIGRYGPDELFFLDYELLDQGIVELSFAPTIDSVPRLSAKQAAAIATGLNFLASVVDDNERAEIQGILDLLKSGSYKDSKLPIDYQFANTLDEVSLLRRAISEEVVISCEYMNSAGQLSLRTIEPLFLQSTDSVWFLKGFCQEKHSIRVFRVDRMRKLELTGDKVSKAARALSIDDDIYTPKPSDIDVLFEVDPEGYSLIADFKPDQVISATGMTKVTIPIGQLENLPRIVARYGGHVRVLAPQKARRLVHDFAQAALNDKAVSLSEVE